MQLFNINALDSYLERSSQCNSDIFLLPNRDNTSHPSSTERVGDEQSPNISLNAKTSQSFKVHPYTKIANDNVSHNNAAVALDSFQTYNNDNALDPTAGLQTLQALKQFEADINVNYKSSAYRNRRRLKSEEHYKAMTFILFNAFYPVICKKCNIRCTKKVSGYERKVRCSKCHKIYSRFVHTPLHQSKMPLWMFSAAIEESYISYPEVVTATRLQKKLKIGTETALDLKRRVQLFCSQQMEAVKVLFYKELVETFKDNYRLPKGDLTQDPLYNKIPHIDCKVIFSRTQRSLKGRKTKARGQTASIYLTESLGGDTKLAEEKPSPNISSLNREELPEYSDQSDKLPSRFVADGGKKSVETAGIEPASYHAI